MRKKKLEKIRTVLVVYNYHLHGQRGQLTVWENDKKNSGLINFVQESRLLLAQTGFHLTKKGYESPKLVSKMALKKSNTIPLETIRPGKQDYLFRTSVAPGNFPPKRHEKKFFIKRSFFGNFL